MANTAPLVKCEIHFISDKYPVILLSKSHYCEAAKSGNAFTRSKTTPTAESEHDKIGIKSRSYQNTELNMQSLKNVFLPRLLHRHGSPMTRLLKEGKEDCHRVGCSPQDILSLCDCLACFGRGDIPSHAQLAHGDANRHGTAPCRYFTFSLRRKDYTSRLTLDFTRKPSIQKGPSPLLSLSNRKLCFAAPPFANSPLLLTLPANL